MEGVALTHVGGYEDTAELIRTKLYFTNLTSAPFITNTSPS